MDIIIPMIDGRGQVDSLGIRGNAIECVALAAASVGKEAFSQYQQEVMKLILELAEAEKLNDDPRTKPLSRCWGNFAKILGEDFKPYFGQILPRLLGAAARKPNIRLVGMDHPEDETGWKYMIIDNRKKIAYEDGSVELREAAFNMLYWIAKLNAEIIQPHISQILPICVSSFDFVFNTDVRTSSASASCNMLEIISRTEEPAVVQAAAGQIFQGLVQALLKESDKEVILVQIDCLHEVSSSPSSIGSVSD